MVDLGREAADVGGAVEGEEVAFDALEGRDGCYELGAGCDPHGGAGGDAPGFGGVEGERAEALAVGEGAVAVGGEEDDAGEGVGGDGG